jgi:circadian clock protein KaiC
MSERFRTGVPGFDVITLGGLIRGGTCIISGDPGAGKTVFANQVALHHVADGGRVLYVTVLAESISRLLGHLSTFAFFDRALAGDRLQYVSAHTALKDSSAAVLDLIRSELLKHRPTLLVVDGLETVLASFTDERYLKAFLHDLGVAADHLGCTALFLAASRLNASVHAAAAVVDGLIELTQEPLGTRVIRSVVVHKLRGTGVLEGRHLFEIAGEGITVFPRFESQFRYPSLPIGHDASVCTFDTPSLDAMLGGGVSAGSSTMVLGGTGTGKTLLAAHFMTAGAERGQPGLYFGTYEAPARLIASVHAVGLRLEKHVGTGTVEIQWEPGIDMILDRTGARILDAVRRRGVRRLVIDGLGAFQAAGAHAERLTTFMTALLNELRGLNVTTLITAETAPLFATQFDLPSQGVSQILDNLILLRFVESRSQLHRLISVLKVRERAYDPSLREFHITEAGFDVIAAFESGQALLTEAEGQTSSGPREGEPK